MIRRGEVPACSLRSALIAAVATLTTILLAAMLALLSTSLTPPISESTPRHSVAAATATELTIDTHRDDHVGKTTGDQSSEQSAFRGPHGGSSGSSRRMHRNRTPADSLASQLASLEATLSPEMVANFDYQKESSFLRVVKAASREQRPHMMSFEATQRAFPVPIADSCPSPIRPDMFCAPNLGRDWRKGHTVFPISYSLPEELFLDAAPPLASKTQDCSIIVPRIRSTYKFSSEEAYVEEYRRSFYCLTFKKGGWDVLRHYEIIAAGCMPYLVDIEFMPIYTLYHLPKQLLLEARDLPGVTFNCSAVRVEIDHRIFPRERYFGLLSALIAHAKRYLTTKAMAAYVLSSVNKPNASKVLYLAAPLRKAPLRAQGNYNSWTLFHGMRTLLGSGCVDPYRIPFLYEQPRDVQVRMKPLLYGMGFGYAFRLKASPHREDDEADRKDIISKIKAHYYDLVIFADPTSLVSTASKQLKFLRVVQEYYHRSEILFLHAPDIAYPAADQQLYSPQTLYDAGVVFQREIMDCRYYAPTPQHQQDGESARKAEMMKRCVWYKNRNCFDDVNVISTEKAKQLREYVWDIPPASIV